MFFSGKAIAVAVVTALLWVNPVRAQDSDEATLYGQAMIHDLSALTIPEGDWRIAAGYFGNNPFSDFHVLEVAWAPWEGIQFSTESLLWLARMVNLHGKWTIYSTGEWAVGIEGGVYVLKVDSKSESGDESQTTLWSIPLLLRGTYAPLQSLRIHGLLSYTAVGGKVANSTYTGDTEGIANVTAKVGGVSVGASAEYWLLDWLAATLEFRVPLTSKEEGEYEEGGTSVVGSVEADAAYEDWVVTANVQILPWDWLSLRAGVMYGPLLGGELLTPLLGDNLSPELTQRNFWPTVDLSFMF